MATQLRSTRQLTIAGEPFDWTEVAPHVWELAFPGGPVVGQIIEIPAHGRDKQWWKRDDTGERYLSAMAACGDLVTAYYRQLARTPVPALTLVPPRAPEPEPTALAAEPTVARPPLGVPAGWIKAKAAAVAYGVSPATIADWANAGKIESVLVPGQGYHGKVRWVAPPPAPAQKPPAPAPAITPSAAPAPEPAPLADFASPTIEVQHTPAPDDHPLDTDDPPLAPLPEMRLLTAMQRIGYLEASLEHWQAEAARREQEYRELNEIYTNLLHKWLDTPQQSKPRRWFPFGW
jgi:hypothetical protein